MTKSERKVNQQLGSKSCSSTQLLVHPHLNTLIVEHLGRDVNSYLKNILIFWGSVSRVCPACQGRCIRHGVYYRYALPIPDKIPILRLKCKVCGKTHAILPSFLIPYSPHPTPVHEAVLAQNDSSQRLAKIIDQSRSTVRRWRHGAGKKLSQMCGILRSALLRINPEDKRWVSPADTFCELVRLGRLVLNELGPYTQPSPPGALPWLNAMLSRLEAGAWL